ncbi:unannotated protein [freshwater metagenome]|uniref:Unannotated protein n=1 Tax=freshwater metagenome TaxID=449393 RepID=A0A6J7XT42_9ZZZZ|nr:SRPBCC family protein [Actinomycetota bacterium]
MADNSIALSISLPCEINKAWEAITDWQQQSNWMLQTRVTVTSQIVNGPGTEISAFSGPLHHWYPRFRFFGIVDTMVVTTWTPPFLCEVLHTGSIIQGTGRFELVSVSPNETRFDWSEVIYAPRVIFTLIKPAIYLGVLISLQRFRRTLR